MENLVVKVFMELFCGQKEWHSECKSTLTLKRNGLHLASSKSLCLCCVSPSLIASFALGPYNWQKEEPTNQQNIQGLKCIT